jgi:hypothetical protein
VTFPHNFQTGFAAHLASWAMGSGSQNGRGARMTSSHSLSNEWRRASAWRGQGQLGLCLVLSHDALCSP